MKYKSPVILLLIFALVVLINQMAHSQNTDIVINEICPTGCASSGYQWIEIYNKGETQVDLENWKFWEADTEHGLNIAPSSTEQDFLIESGEYAIIAQNDLYFFENNPDVTSTVFDSSWGTLNKSGELIGLKDSNEGILERFTYKAIEDYSLERKDVEELLADENNWTEHPDGNTVAEENYWRVENTDDSGDDDTDDTGDTNDGDDDEISTSTLPISTSTIPIATSTAPTLVINEFVSDPVSGESEWIEIYNFSTGTVSLEDWELHEGDDNSSTNTKKLVSLEGILESESFYVVELSSSKLNNSGDKIFLLNTSSTIIDTVSYGSWDDGNTNDNAPKADDPNSVARIIDGQDTDNDKNDFDETTSSTKGLPNIIIVPVVETPTPSSGGGGGSAIVLSVTYNLGDLVINELVSDPTDNEEEFVEIYNTTSQTINLDGWWIEDGSESKTTLEGNISANGFYVIEKPKGNLNNAGDIIVLFSPKAKEIDKITYGTWDDGNVNDNAQAPEDPLSIIRKIDGQDSDNDYYDFVLTSTVTKGKSNVVSAVSKDGEVIEQMVGSTEVIINEVFPNPEGSDSDDEFIEIKNLGSETINLQNWRLSDSGQRKYKIKQGSIKPGGLFLFKRSMTGIALNNSGGDEVKLFSPNESLVDNIKYSGSAGEGESYSHKDDNSWAWTITPTPGKGNIIKGKSAAPIVSIDVDTEIAVGETVLFDASDTTDPEGEDMSFVWDFGDGTDNTGDSVAHGFVKEGIYTVKLLVVDSSDNESKKQVIITVKNRFAFSGGGFLDDVVKVEISEFIPNPEGSDTTEFVEIFNPTDEDVDLFDFKLDDEEGGSRAYTFPENSIIPAGSYTVFGRQDTKLALNNTGDSVRLLYPDGTILQEVRYDDVPEGASYVPDENEIWVWSGTNTPGESNIITPVVEKKSSRTVSRSKRIKPIINTTLENLRNEDVGDKVKVTGVVAVEPGVLATQYFYIVGSPGVQVYMYKKDFPSLKIGDRIEVTGEITESYGNTRVKLSSRDDIKKIDHPGDPQPKVTEVAEVQEQLEGWLVEVHGEITEIKGSYMYVDDGTEEVKVYFKRGAGINKKIYQVGDLVSVSGLVYQTKSGYQILPRFQEDIEKTGVAENMIVQMENIEGEDKKEVAEKYLTATAGGLTSLLVGLFAKARGSTALGFIKKLAGIGVAVIRRKPKV